MAGKYQERTSAVPSIATMESSRSGTRRKRGRTNCNGLSGSHSMNIGLAALSLCVRGVSSKPVNRCPLRPAVSRSPLIIGHRGASFHLPEHTLASYRLALELGADFIEPDLVPCRDGTLVAMHSLDLNVTTDVHEYDGGVFRDMARQINGEWGYYVQDFTWEEVKRLSVRQRVGESGARSDQFDYLWKVPSFAEIVDLLHDWNMRVLPLIGRPSDKTSGVPGMYVELKQPALLLEDANVSIADLFLDALAGHPEASELLFDHTALCQGLKHDEYRVPPLVIQSFSGETLEYLHAMFRQRWADFVEEELGLPGINGTDDDSDHPWIPPMVLLVDSKYCRSPDFWFEIEKLHIDGVGPDKSCLLPSEPTVLFSNDTEYILHVRRASLEWVKKAHSEHKAVHPWTSRLEKEELGQAGGVPSLFFSAQQELLYFFCELHVDGIFTENIATARVIAAGGCDGYDPETYSLKEAADAVMPSTPVCVEEERNLWLFGLAFGAIGAFSGSVLACLVSSIMTRRKYGTGSQSSTEEGAPRRQSTLRAVMAGSVPRRMSMRAQNGDIANNSVMRTEGGDDQSSNIL